MPRLVIITLLLCGLITSGPCYGKASKWPYPYPPSLAPNSGPYPTARDLSIPTLCSITTHLAVTLGLVKRAKDYDFEKVDPEMKEKLREIFGNTTVDCRVLLKPNGQISDLTIWKSTAPRDLEVKACELIRKSAPFEKNVYPDNLRYAVTFPNYDRTLIYWNEQVDINSMPYRVEPVQEKHSKH
jgi:hypothetical protein